MHEREQMARMATAPDASSPSSPPAQQMVERDRAIAFGQMLRILLERQEYYVPLTGAYLLTELSERTRAVDGCGIQANSLRAYLRGETLPSDTKVRLIADALHLPRGVLLFAAGYLTLEDLPDYPGHYTTLEAVEADIAEITQLPLSGEAKARILYSLRNTARILRLLAAERAQTGWQVARDERELVIEHLLDLWESQAPPPPEPAAPEKNAVLAPVEAETPRLAATPPISSATISTAPPAPATHH